MEGANKANNREYDDEMAGGITHDQFEDNIQYSVNDSPVVICDTFGNIATNESPLKSVSNQAYEITFHKFSPNVAEMNNSETTQDDDSSKSF